MKKIAVHPDEYTPYGQRQVHTHGWLMSDLNGDGVVDSADESIVSAGSDPAADLDGDGDIDTADLALVQADLGQALPASDPLVTRPAAMSFRGDLAQTSGVALCPVGHQGLIHDEELGTSGGGSLIYNRARHLHPRLGRFMQRDPLGQDEPGGGYQDGLNLYQPNRSNSHRHRDPTGTVCCCECPGGDWSTVSGTGFASSGGLIIGAMTFTVELECDADPSISTTVAGHGYGAGAIVSIAGRVGVAGRAWNAPSCSDLYGRMGFRLYGIGVGVGGGTLVAVTTNNGASYEMGSVGLNLSLNKILSQGLKGITVMGGLGNIGCVK